MKKLLSLLLALALVLSMGFAVAEEDNWKIAIMTGTTAQGEEEFRAAQKLIAQYGEEHVLYDTYPENFSSEVEITIGKLIAMASDPDVKAIIFVQAVQGATAAFKQIREEMGRDDILLIAGVAAEDPWMICPAADLVLSTDDINTGYQIIEQCSEWGCEVFIHYSFARHLGYESISTRLAIFKEQCELYGIQLVERDAPDPTSEVGTSGAQQFILEDVPKVMEEFAGKKVGFFTTNCGMQVALQMSILEQPNAYYPLPCCPSPFHGFPESLGLEANADDYNDLDGYIKKIAAILSQYDALGRYSTWAAPVNMNMIAGSFSYALAYIAGETDGKVDMAKFEECFEGAAACDVGITTYVDADGKEYTNLFYLLCDNIDFNDYYTE